MLNEALKLARMGLSVIPLQSRSKKALISWSEFQKRRASEDEIKTWFEGRPNLNVGIVTGDISGIAIVDLDGTAGSETGKSLNLSSPTTVITGKGRHLWFKAPKHGLKNSVKSLPGLDVRGEGGLVVAPPSVHENGLRYRWLAPLRERLILPEFPLDILNPSPEAQLAENAKKGNPEGWVAKALEEMTNGNIDNTLFSICSKLRATGFSSDDARTLLLPHANRVGATPGHLDEKINNVWARYSVNVPPSTGIDVRWPDAGTPLGLDGGVLRIHKPTDVDSWNQFVQRSEMAKETNGLVTGYGKLDEMLKGGLKSSRLFTVAARTGTGKTNWLLAAAQHLCKQGFSVLLFSTEMAYSDIWDRYIALTNGANEFKQHNFYVCDSFAPNLEKIEEAIREVKPDVFMFDHINHVSEEQRELGAFMQGLNFLRRKYDCAGIVAAQLNRAADWVDLKTGERVTPRMSMIKGSGTIEQASSRVLLLSETRVTPDMSEIVGNLDKNDNGPKGMLHFGLLKSPYRMVQL